jgi:hypothetical protein
MNPSSRRVLSSFLLVVALALPAVAATRRRAVRVDPPAEGTFTGTVSGTVIDAVTGKPIVQASVTAPGQKNLRKGTSNSTGAFNITNVYGAANITVTAARSGYATNSVVATSQASTGLTIRLTPLATASLTRTDVAGSVEVDADSIEFGYVSGFSDYISDTFDDFCTTDGTHIQMDRSEMKRIIGPSTLVAPGSCCSGTTVEKISVETKNAGTQELRFLDSCAGYPEVLIAREHVSGKYIYIPFSKVAQVVFPATIGAATAPAAVKGDRTH